jgi:hypothetical protein
MESLKAIRQIGIAICVKCSSNKAEVAAAGIPQDASVSIEDL